MVHLDIGFTDLARGVCELYFDKHYPAAIALAEALAARGGPEQYAWTSHPWMVQEYLDGVAGCAPNPRTPAQVSFQCVTIPLRINDRARRSRQWRLRLLQATFAG